MSQRFLLNPHTKSLTNGCAYLSCVCMGLFVLSVMILLDVGEFKPEMYVSVFDASSRRI